MQCLFSSSEWLIRKLLHKGILMSWFIEVPGKLSLHIEVLMNSLQHNAKIVKALYYATCCRCGRLSVLLLITSEDRNLSSALREL